LRENLVIESCPYAAKTYLRIKLAFLKKQEYKVRESASDLNNNRLLFERDFFVERLISR